MFSHPTLTWLVSIPLLVLTGLTHTAHVSSRPPTARSLTDTPLVFDDVTVIDVAQGRRLSAQRVVIVGNRITRMGAARTVSIPKGAQVVDARGKFLIPGLWDMHTHSDRDIDVFYPLFIANGVTGIRDAASPVPLDTLRLWRREILAGTRVGPPRQILSGGALDNGTFTDQGGFTEHCTGRGSEHLCIEPGDSADARHVVDSLKAAGADMIKTYWLNRAMYFVIAAEARRIGIPFGGHLMAATAIEASDSGAGILDHTNQAGDLWSLCSSAASITSCRPVANRFRRNGTWLVPTLLAMIMIQEEVTKMGGGMVLNGVGPARPTSLVHIARLGQVDSAFWGGANIPSAWLRTAGHPVPLSQAAPPGATADSGGLLRIAQRAGLPVMAGTDVSGPSNSGTFLPGFSLQTELAVYVSEGLTPLEALQTATLNPANFLHGTDSLGTVAPGKLADLVLLDADPLVDITNTTAIRAVVANGRYYDRPALDLLLRMAKAKLGHVSVHPRSIGDSQDARDH